MPKYTQTLTFKREVSITAPDAARANDQLQDLISSSEFHGDVRVDDYYDFEDEPVECPQCKGNCTVDDEDEEECPRCKGEGSVPFEAEDKA
jgi:hypothetical protein